MHVKFADVVAYHNELTFSNIMWYNHNITLYRCALPSLVAWQWCVALASSSPSKRCWIAHVISSITLLRDTAYITLSHLGLKSGAFYWSLKECTERLNAIETYWWHIQVAYPHWPCCKGLCFNMSKGVLGYSNHQKPCRICPLCISITTLNHCLSIHRLIH